MSTTMPDNQIAALELQFARQLYDRCLERHGENNEQTRIVLRYISALENPKSRARDGETLRPTNAGVGQPALEPCSQS